MIGELPVAELNSHSFESLYRALDIDLDTLGCVMLRVQPVRVSDLIPEDWAYRTDNPKRFWIRGLEGGDHITLLYGLLTQRYGSESQYHSAVDTVLDGWWPEVEIDSIGSFPSPYDDENYACIIAHVRGNLADAHQRLSFLPHINTFPTYKSHLTLCYVKAERRDQTIARLNEGLGANPRVTPLEVDYGRFQA